MPFDPIKCEEYVRMLIDYDEVERALLVLNNIPAEFREHTPWNLIELKATIQGSICTPHTYLDCDLDSTVSVESALSVMKNTIRGRIIEAEVKRYNESGITPHIVDMGPGEYFIPIALKELNHRFTYSPLAMDQKAKAAARDYFRPFLADKPDSPTIFVALEVIEHLPHTGDIAIEAYKNTCGRPERIHLSTPHNTYDARPKNWEHRSGLPHLRAYTRDEFIQEAFKLFPDYAFQLYDDKVMSLRGMRKDCLDPKPLF